MTDIKIFVSHRKDMDSRTINNPLYVNVVCGQTFTDLKKGKIGDNTGDNISLKSPYYSEFTVQYWAWKNQKADYFGLCHYRRYLSFAEKMYPEWNEQRVAFEPKMNQKALRKYGLLDYKAQKKEIEKYDLITSVTYECKNIPNIPKFKNVQEAFAKSPALFTSDKHINNMKDIVKNKFPQYYTSLVDELKSKRHRGFNCFIMKKELFDLMCTFQFGTLFEVEKTLNLKNRAGNSIRELGYLGEILYGAFIRWVISQKKYKVKETQIVLYLDTTKNVKQSNFKKIILKIKDKIQRIKFTPNKKMDVLLDFVQRQNAMIMSLNNSINVLNNKIENERQRNKELFFSLPRDFSDDLDSKKMQFWKSYPQATGDLRIIQEANAVLLKNFKNICDTLQCEFWLHGGSLIGGLRHKGYIPWDDDIDIAMMRDDFNKIKKYLTGKSKIYEIQDNYYIQLGCRSYRFKRKDIESNCFVDIFIYDNYSLKYGNPLIDWQNLCCQKKRLRASSVETCKELSVAPKEPTLKGFETLRKCLDNLFDMYIRYNTSDSKNSEYILWNLDNNYEDETKYAWHHGRIFEKSDIFPFKKVLYEGIEVNVPHNYEKYAFAEYGMRYLDMPNNIGQAIHYQEFFHTKDQIDLAKKIIKDGVLIG